MALTAGRLGAAVASPGGDVLKTLFTLKDCVVASVKYLGAVLLAEYLRSPARTPGFNEQLLEKLVRPSLGVWVSRVVGDLSRLLIGSDMSPGRDVAGLFVTLAAGRGARPQPTVLLARCEAFVNYRNDALGHGATRSDAAYAKDLAEWLPVVRRLLDGVAGMAAWRLCLVTAAGATRAM